MKLLKNLKHDNPDRERIALIIANRLIAIQAKLAGRINRWINKYPPVYQKRMLLLFCLFSAGCLVLSLYGSFTGRALPTSAETYVPTHIGQSSGALPVMTANKKLTDSLTSKHLNHANAINRK